MPRTNDEIREIIRTRVAAGASAYQIGKETGQCVSNIMRYIRVMDLFYPTKAGCRRSRPAPPKAPDSAGLKAPDAPTPPTAPRIPKPPPTGRRPKCSVCGSAPATRRVVEGKEFFGPCASCRTLDV